MSPAHLLRRHWLLAVAILLFISGAIFRAQAAESLIVSPSPDSIIYGPEVTVTFSTAPVQLIDYKLHPKPVVNQGHLLLWLDQTTFPVDSAIKVFTPTHTFANLKSGPHTLVVELVSNNHTSLNPPVKSTLSFTTAPLTPKKLSSSSSSLLLFTSFTIILLVISLYIVNSHIRSLHPLPVKKTSSKSKSPKSKSKSRS